MASYLFEITNDVNFLPLGFHLCNSIIYYENLFERSRNLAPSLYEQKFSVTKKLTHLTSEIKRISTGTTFDVANMAVNINQAVFIGYENMDMYVTLGERVE